MPAISPDAGACPACGGRGVSIARKLCLGPALSVACRSCGGRIGVPWKVLWYLAPLEAVILGAAWLSFRGVAVPIPLLAGAVLLAAGFTVLGCLRTPLVLK